MMAGLTLAFISIVLAAPTVLTAMISSAVCKSSGKRGAAISPHMEVDTESPWGEAPQAAVQPQVRFLHVLSALSFFLGRIS